MSIVVHAQNNTDIDQQVQVRDNPLGLALANVAIPAQGNVILHVEPANANIDLYLICNNNAVQMAELSLVYQGFSSVVQDRRWTRRWTVDGTPDGVLLKLA